MTTEITCALQFIRKELYHSFKNFKSDLLDNLIAFINWIVVFGYCMPSSGQNNMGPLIFVGALASFGFFGTVWRCTFLSQDVSDNKMNAYLILPMPSRYVFICTALSWSIYAAIITLCLFPIGAATLWSKLDFSRFSLIRFSTIFLLSHLLYGFFSLWLSSLITNLRNSGWLWCRVVNPLFMFSGFFYTWKELFGLSHWIGVINLINPLLYIVEATKISFFGAEEYLPYSLCLLVVSFFTAFFTLDGIRRFKKRVDFCEGIQEVSVV